MVMFTLGPIPLSLPPLSVNKPLLNPLKYFGKTSVGTHALVSLVHGKRLPPKMWSPPLESTKTPKILNLPGRSTELRADFLLELLSRLQGRTLRLMSPAVAFSSARAACASRLLNLLLSRRELPVELSDIADPGLCETKKEQMSEKNQVVV